MALKRHLRLIVVSVDQVLQTSQALESNYSIFHKSDYIEINRVQVTFSSLLAESLENLIYINQEPTKHQGSQKQDFLFLSNIMFFEIRAIAVPFFGPKSLQKIVWLLSHTL